MTMPALIDSKTASGVVSLAADLTGHNLAFAVVAAKAPQHGTIWANIPGWTKVRELAGWGNLQAKAISLALYVKEQPGNETISFNSGSMVPIVAALYVTNASQVLGAAIVPGSGADPNAPALTVDEGADAIFGAVVATLNDIEPTAAPDGYDGLHTQPSDIATGVALGIAFKEAPSGAEDPGAFTGDASKYLTMTFALA